MATLENIQVTIVRLQAEAKTIVKKQVLTAIARIGELTEKHGLTLADLETHLCVRRRGRQKVGVKTTRKRNDLGVTGDRHIG